MANNPQTTPHTDACGLMPGVDQMHSTGEQGLQASLLTYPAAALYR